MVELSHVSSGCWRIQIGACIRKCCLSLDGLPHDGENLSQGDNPGGSADLQASHPQPADWLQQRGGKHHLHQKEGRKPAVRELPDQQDAPASVASSTNSITSRNFL